MSIEIEAISVRRSFGDFGLHINMLIRLREEPEHGHNGVRQHTRLLSKEGRHDVAPVRANRARSFPLPYSKSYKPAANEPPPPAISRHRATPSSRKKIKDAFAIHPFQILLRHLGVSSIVLAGLTTNSCILCRAHDANMRERRVPRQGH